MEPAIPIAELLRDLGFDSPEAQAAARDVLARAGVQTNLKKLNIAAEKRERASEALRAVFLVTCGTADCAREADGRILIVSHDRARCWVCGGSSNRRSIDLAAAAFRRHGVSKIVVVGGSPAVRDELRQLAPANWELRLIDGTERHTLDAARNDLRWADLVLIWGGSELDHKVSEHYTNAGSDRVVRVTRRGIAALLDGAMRWARNK